MGTGQRDLDGSIEAELFPFTQVAEISPRQASSAVAVVNAASSGNLKVLEFLHRDLRFSLPKYSIATAAGGGHIEVIEWLLEQKVSIPEQDTYREAASNGRLDVIKYLRQKHNIAFGCEPLAFAETHSHFHVVKFIMETQNLPTPSKFWLDAAAAGNIVSINSLLSSLRYSPQQTVWKVFGILWQTKVIHSNIH